jgi:hypothetical protein
MIVAIGFALVNVGLWFATPTIRNAVDRASGRLDAPYRPTIGFGVQELLVYYDPWLAGIVFPLVFTVGFVAIPFLGLRSDRDRSPQATSQLYLFVSASLLVMLESLWLLLTAITIWCRGPNWIFYWPGEEWDPFRLVPWNRFDLSEYFWHVCDVLPPKSWAARELPGFLLLAGYFLLGAVMTFRLRGKRSSAFRLLGATWLFQLALLIPIKMVCVLVYNLKYFVALPEFLINV